MPGCRTACRTRGVIRWGRADRCRARIRGNLRCLFLAFALSLPCPCLLLRLSFALLVPCLCLLRLACLWRPLRSESSQDPKAPRILALVCGGATGTKKITIRKRMYKVKLMFLNLTCVWPKIQFTTRNKFKSACTKSNSFF